MTLTHTLLISFTQLLNIIKNKVITSKLIVFFFFKEIIRSLNLK